MIETPYTDFPICTTEDARAAGMDVPPSPSELTAVAKAIVATRDDEPVPEVDLARAVPLLAAEVERLCARIEILTQQRDDLLVGDALAERQGDALSMFGGDQ